MNDGVPRDTPAAEQGAAANTVTQSSFTVTGAVPSPYCVV